ncbi:MAG: GNAT family N-acetyltransferase [Cyclobacteriaceae bacterium]|nr:GNAT family N-acetyltransferase [Cyclobacteriaceae bacterium]
MEVQQKVMPTSLADREIIFALFEQSIHYQQTKGYNVWKNYDRGVILLDIENTRQYKIEIDNQIAIVFSIAYEDKIIWRHHDQSKSVYLHRIVVNPAFKGRKLFGKILEWVIAHGKAKHLDSIRMDTWADNPTLQKYYQQFGFRVVENFITPNSTDLPTHNRNLAITLLEYSLN